MFVCQLDSGSQQQYVGLLSFVFRKLFQCCEGFGKLALLEQQLSALDRKSTRLNSSHT